MNNETLSPLELGRAFVRTVVERNPPGSYPWHYETGLILLAVWKFAAKTGDEGLRAYVRSCAEALVDESGAIKGYRVDEYNLDQINAGKVLLELAAEGTDGRWETAARTLRGQLAGHPRTQAGAYWHKQIYPYQVWLDGLYMQGPFALRWALERNEPETAADTCAQLLIAEEKTRDPSTGLLHHAWDESRKQLWADPESGRSPHAWGRAMGWFAMAVVDCLELLPVDHPDRDAVVGVLERTASAILVHRDPVSGFWFQVLDQAGRPGNYAESSASAMFCCALAKGVRLGALAADPYASAAREAFASLAAARASVAADGTASLSGICKVAGLGGHPYRDGSFSYYVGEAVGPDDFKGVGPFILAALELG